MVDVIKWPPVGMSSFELSVFDPISQTNSLIDNQPVISRYGRSRRVATISVSGISYDAAGAGYMEMLKEFLDGGANLIRIDMSSAIWHFVRASNNPAIANFYVTWTEPTDAVGWTEPTDAVAWFSLSLTGTPSTASDGWPTLFVEGVPPNTIICRPHEWISLYSEDGTFLERRRATNVATSNSIGNVSIRVDSAFTVSPAIAVIGDTESIVFRAIELPRAVQPQLGQWQYTWNLVEAFSDEYTGGFTEKDPWG